MIRNDFKEGGFLVNKQRPVLCTTENGDLYIAYNRYTLGITLQNRSIKKCVGIWPGKFNTDCFPLNPAAYCNTPIPPPEHQIIDNAIDIQVFFSGDLFENLQYIIEDSNGQLTIESKDKNLYEYVRTSGLQYKNTEI